MSPPEPLQLLPPPAQIVPGGATSGGKLTGNLCDASAVWFGAHICRAASPSIKYSAATLGARTESTKPKVAAADPLQNGAPGDTGAAVSTKPPSLGWTACADGCA